MVAQLAADLVGSDTEFHDGVSATRLLQEPTTQVAYRSTVDVVRIRSILSDCV